MGSVNQSQPIVGPGEDRTLLKSGGWRLEIPVFGCFAPVHCGVFRSFPRKRGFRVWYGDCMYHGYSRSSCRPGCLTDGCLEPERFTGQGMQISPYRGISAHQARFCRSFGSKGTVLEASDWLLGAKGHLPGRGGGPKAFRVGITWIHRVSLMVALLSGQA